MRQPASANSAETQFDGSLFFEEKSASFFLSTKNTGFGARNKASDRSLIIAEDARSRSSARRTSIICNIIRNDFADSSSTVTTLECHGRLLSANKIGRASCRERV